MSETDSEKAEVIGGIVQRRSGGSGSMDSGAECETEEDSAPEACVSPEGGPALPSNNRHQRNLAEKQRRDKLNAFINELSTLVPMIAKSPKRMDKTSILRLTAVFLRIYQTLLNGKLEPHMELPKHVDQCLLEQLVCDELGGFLIILTSSGKIIFVSQTVENLLAHSQTDLMGQSLFNICAPDDHDRLRTYLKCSGAVEADWRKYFTVRLKRAGPRAETPVYEAVKMIGMHRTLDTFCMNSPSSSRELLSPTSSTSSASDTDILVFFAKVCRPERIDDLLLEAAKDEYVTRHLLDGRIISCDQRISLVAGYMTDEVSGMSAFRYMHRDDVRWVMIALRQMYDKGESRGTSCYRLVSRNGQFIYLRTFGFLEIDDQGTVESFVCVNVLVSESVGMQLINDMKKKFSAIIAHTSIDSNMLEADTEVVDQVEDPAKLDNVVAHLVSNLPSPGSDSRSTPSPRIQYPPQSFAPPPHLAHQNPTGGRMPYTAATSTTVTQQQIPVPERSNGRCRNNATGAGSSSMPPNHQPYRSGSKRRVTIEDLDDNLNNKRLKPPASPSRCVSPYSQGLTISELPSTETI
ncbi:aryl hydrocarbon receptor nuclear translocator-like protein 1 isoform X3 [Aethina tumida]|uniref:aryl hydrocarbon receptor nuclear translocator-like protein 1 isoform X3 n=1 Tax=Aethina tumida TaxID=116153 RepID=UPI0021497A4B|nr:aryl hydrocarbon receptor nuclear translocator-like protein 1 isoform X3 [Aethina tumida]